MRFSICSFDDPSESLILNVCNSRVQFRVSFCSGRRFTLQQPGCTLYGYTCRCGMKMDEPRNRSEKYQQRARENPWASCTTNWFIHYVLAHFSTVFVSSMRRKYAFSSMLQNPCCFARIKANESWCVIMRSNTKEYSGKLLTYGGFNCHVWSCLSFKSFACQHLQKLYMLLCRIWYAFPKIERTDWR